MYVKNKKIFIALLFAMLASILMTLYASSRTVVIALLAAIPFYLLKSLKEHLGKKMRFFIMLLITLSVLYPFFEEATLGIRSKVEMSSEHNDIFYTRVKAWNTRIDEFFSSPIFGVGTHTTGFHKHEGNEGLFQKSSPNLNGQIEPGNAWLYFLSSMGIVGFMAVMFLLVPISKRLLLSQQRQSDGILVGSLLVYSYVYMMAEAHVTACGDYNCVYFWLLISIAGIKDITLPERRIGIIPVISNVFLKVS